MMDSEREVAQDPRKQLWSFASTVLYRVLYAGLAFLCVKAGFFPAESGARVAYEDTSSALSIIVQQFNQALLDDVERDRDLVRLRAVIEEQGKLLNQLSRQMTPPIAEASVDPVLSLSPPRASAPRASARRPSGIRPGSSSMGGGGLADSSDAAAVDVPVGASPPGVVAPVMADAPPPSPVPPAAPDQEEVLVEIVPIERSARKIDLKIRSVEAIF